MPASVVIVQTDPIGVALCADAARRAGNDVATFCIPAKFLDAMNAAEPGRMRVLLIDALLPEGQPNSVAIARMAKLKRPALRVAFMAEVYRAPEMAEYAADVGGVVDPHPVRVLRAIAEMLEAGGEDPAPDRRGL